MSEDGDYRSAERPWHSRSPVRGLGVALAALGVGAFTYMAGEADGQTVEDYRQQEAAVETVEERQSSLLCEGEIVNSVGDTVPIRYEEDVEAEDGEDMNVLTVEIDDITARYFDTKEERNLDLDAGAYTSRRAEVLERELPNGKVLRDDIRVSIGQQLYFNDRLERVWEKARTEDDFCRQK